MFVSSPSMGRPALDIKGKRYGNVLVVRLVGKAHHGANNWEYVCDCGTIKTAAASSLFNGLIMSCGCKKTERFTEFATTHGMCETRTYKAWQNLKQRCLNPDNSDSKYYQNRGIVVCERWLKFENFYEDMGECPEGLELDRIDCDKGYYKENCRWVSELIQSRNRRHTKYYGRL